MLIIGLGHRARQGKDLLASFLNKKYGYKVYHFADSLKKECGQIFNWHDGIKNITAYDAVFGQIKSQEQLSSFIEKLNNALGVFVEIINNPEKDIGLKMQGRFFPFKNDSLLQYWGELRRFQDADYWIKSVFADIVSECQYDDKVVIADLRYPNEMKWIKLFGSANIRIERILPDGRQYIDPCRNPDHPSESSLIGAAFDLTIQIPEATTIDGLVTNIVNAGKKVIRYVG